LYPAAPGAGIRRLNADGSLDASFSVVTNLTDSISDRGTVPAVSGIAAQPDGKLVIWGGFNSVRGMARTNLARLNPDGSVDDSFNPAPLLGSLDSELILRCLVQVDGKILVARNIKPGDQGLFRLYPNGSLDPTFHPTLDLMDGPGIGLLTDLKLQADGKILVATAFPSDLPGARARLVRLRTDGSVDEIFDAGNAVSGFENIALAQAPDDKLLVFGRPALAGFFDPRLREELGLFQFVRLNGDGRLLKIRSARRLFGGLFEIQLGAPVGATIVLEGASILAPPNWEPLSTNAVTGTPVTITDLTAPHFGQRFYRGRIR
jgi:uncharacterized delta-60 repeat protein